MEKEAFPTESERAQLTEPEVRETFCLAKSVFESQDAATTWMFTPNMALGGVMPVVCCRIMEGAKQVRRILHAIEWGGVV